jgi:hypothetical protein
MTNEINDYIKESLADAGFSKTYEPDRIKIFSERLVARHLAEFYAIRFDLNGADVYNQIEKYLDHKFKQIPLDE